MVLNIVQGNLFSFCIYSCLYDDRECICFQCGGIISESIQSLSEVFNCTYVTCPNDAATAKDKQGNCSLELDGYACLINKEPETTSKGKVFSKWIF